MYSDKVKELFLHPRNVGEIEHPAGFGEIGNVKCGDIMRLTFSIDPTTLDRPQKLDHVIGDIKFKTFGCAAAIATSSMITELAKGKTLAEARLISNAAVAQELGGLPPLKMHCSNLAADALKKAINYYLGESTPDNPSDHDHETTDHCGHHC